MNNNNKKKENKKKFMCNNSDIKFVRLSDLKQLNITERKTENIPVQTNYYFAVSWKSNPFNIQYEIINLKSRVSNSTKNLNFHLKLSNVNNNCLVGLREDDLNSIL